MISCPEVSTKANEIYGHVVIKQEGEVVKYPVRYLLDDHLDDSFTLACLLIREKTSYFAAYSCCDL